MPRTPCFPEASSLLRPWQRVGASLSSYRILAREWMRGHVPEFSSLFSPPRRQEKEPASDLPPCTASSSRVVDRSLFKANPGRERLSEYGFRPQKPRRHRLKHERSAKRLCREPKRSCSSRMMRTSGFL